MNYRMSTVNGSVIGNPNSGKTIRGSDVRLLKL